MPCHTATQHSELLAPELWMPASQHQPAKATHVRQSVEFCQDCLSQLAGRCCERVLVLLQAPHHSDLLRAVQNNLAELFMLMHFLDAAKFGSLEEFQEEYADLGEAKQANSASGRTAVLVPCCRLRPWFSGHLDGDAAQLNRHGQNFEPKLQRKQRGDMAKPSSPAVLRSLPCLYSTLDHDVSLAVRWQGNTTMRQ